MRKIAGKHLEVVLTLVIFIAFSTGVLAAEKNLTANSTYSVGIGTDAGSLQGGPENLEDTDSVLLNWTDVFNSGAETDLYVNLTTDIPPYVVKEIGTYLRIDRSVDVYSKQLYNNSTRGKINYSNSDGNATYFEDTEHASIYETSENSDPETREKGFRFQMPENISETSYSNLELYMDVSADRVDEAEVLEVKAYNNSSGSYSSCANISGTDETISCELPAPEDFLSGDSLRVIFEDNLSSTEEQETVWRIDRVYAGTGYENPQDPAFTYSTGFLDREGVKQQQGFSPSSTQETFFSILPGENAVGETGLFRGTVSFNRQKFEDYRAEHNFSIDLYRAEINYSESEIVNYTVGVEDSTGSRVEGVNFTVFDSGHIFEEFSSFGQSYSERLAENHSYSIRQSIPVFDQIYNVTFHGLNLSSDQSPETQFVNYSGSLDVQNVSKIYAVNETGLEFEEAEIEVPKRKGSPNAVIHCTDWSFSNSECNTWEINDLRDYPHTETENSVEFNVTGFDAYGTASGEPLPNITEVRIYDVTDAADREKGGTLVASGLNETFELEQQASRREYRFEFVVENQGEVDWEIAAEDELSHEGLNETWEVGKTWYNLSSQKTGGTFSGGAIEWDTSNNGVLDEKDGNNTMWAKYIVNVSTADSRLYDQRFDVNDTSTNSGSYDLHQLNITKYGFLDVQLETPPDGTTVVQNTTFDMNATVECMEGRCGDVNLSARYNESAEADTLIPENSGEPFHTNDTNTGRCGTGLEKGDSCYRSWSVNATGELNSVHLVDANASSSLLEIPENDSDDAQVSIDRPMLIDVRWDRIDFGVLDPGMEDKPADGNSEGIYNVTVQDESADVDSLWIRATDLTAPGWINPSTGEQYTIFAENTSYSQENDISTEEHLTNSYQRAATDIPSGTNFTSFYWIDVPEGIKTAEYTGKIYFKANATN